MDEEYDEEAYDDAHAEVDADTTEEWLDNDMIEPEEEAFLIGYDQAADEEKEDEESSTDESKDSS